MDSSFSFDDWGQGLELAWRKALEEDHERQAGLVQVTQAFVESETLCSLAVVWRNFFGSDGTDQGLRTETHEFK